MRFALSYRTEYRYSEPVFDQHNTLRVKPASGPLQRVRGFRINVEPSARTRTHVDYFGTEVIDFNIAAEHDRLAVMAEAEVTTEPPPPPPAGGWERARGEAYTNAGGEFLLPSGDEPANGALGELIENARGDGPRATLEAVCELIPSRFDYSPGATFVGSTVDDLLAGGAGVCQDFVHLSLILLRRHGIAARYVSGYLFAPPGDDESADSAEVDTHAWIEALLPVERDAEPVWMPADPTNRILADERHVKIGHGRHYSDVPPVKGVYRGTASADLEASVRMQRTDATGARA
jgi:transglutaminase-like putative cysteine protease